MKLKTILEPILEYIWWSGKKEAPDRFGVDRYRTLIIYSNPTNSELLQLLNSSNYNVAGILDKKGDTYVWNRHLYSHNDMDLDIDIAFYLYHPLFKGDQYEITISRWSTTPYNIDDEEDLIEKVRLALEKSK